jgi:hypothetical protein
MDKKRVAIIISKLAQGAQAHMVVQVLLDLLMEYIK